MGIRLTFHSYLALLLGFLVVSLTADAWARAGGGSSSGSRGSRSYSSPSRSYSTPTPSAPSATPYTPPTAPLPAAPAPAAAGGFLRSLAGGVVGGLLGGMLFRSLGFAGGAGGFGGGFGMMDLLLLGGIAFLIYWMVRRRRAAVATAGGPAFPDTGALYTGGGRVLPVRRCPIAPRGCSTSARWTPASTRPPFGKLPATSSSRSRPPGCTGTSTGCGRS